MSELIAAALREISEQAAPPAPAVVSAEQAWRAGRRRRQVTALSATGVVAAVVAAILLPLAMISAPARGGSSPGGAAGTNSTAAPIQVTGNLRSPLELRQVARTGNLPCAKGGVPPAAGDYPVCYYLTGPSVIIRTVEYVRIGPGGGGAYDSPVVAVTRADAIRLGVLTTRLASLPAPHGQMAIVVRGHVVAAPYLEAPWAAGLFVIPLDSRSQSEALLRMLGS